jgi:hypothetical protein
MRKVVFGKRKKKMSLETVKKNKQSATTSRAGGMRMAPGRGRGHLCWLPLIFKKNLFDLCFR